MGERTIIMTLEFILILIVGVSMSPTYAENSMLWACSAASDGCGFEDVRVGDVISFASGSGPVVHRVIDIDTEDGILITQGDNTITNPEPIAEVDYVTADEYQGKITSQSMTGY